MNLETEWTLTPKTRQGALRGISDILNTGNSILSHLDMNAKSVNNMTKVLRKAQKARKAIDFQDFHQVPGALAEYIRDMKHLCREIQVSTEEIEMLSAGLARETR